MTSNQAQNKYQYINARDTNQDYIKVYKLKTLDIHEPTLKIIHMTTNSSYIYTMKILLGIKTFWIKGIQIHKTANEKQRIETLSFIISQHKYIKIIDMYMYLIISQSGS